MTTQEKLDKLEQEYIRRYKEVQDFTVNYEKAATFVKWKKNYYEPERLKLVQKLKKVK